MKIELTILFSLVINICSAQQTDKIENKIDSLGLMQGVWVEFEARPIALGYTIHDMDDGTSEIVTDYDYSNYDIYKICGSYINSLREGLWNIYLPSGIRLCSVNYKEGVVFGEFVFYFENGNIRLKGNIGFSQQVLVESYTEDGGFKKSYYLSTKKVMEDILK